MTEYQGKLPGNWNRLRETILARAAAGCEVCHGEAVTAPADHPVAVVSVPALEAPTQEEHSRRHGRSAASPAKGAEAAR